MVDPPAPGSGTAFIFLIFLFPIVKVRSLRPPLFLLEYELVRKSCWVEWVSSSIREGHHCLVYITLFLLFFCSGDSLHTAFLNFF